MNSPARPFNRPAGRLGQTLFAFIAWVERRVSASSRVGASAFFGA
ncbi:MAG: hypothetical protein AB7N70_16505 [Dehalococcoidia bacterium]